MQGDRGFLCTCVFQTPGNLDLLKVTQRTSSSIPLFAQTEGLHPMLMRLATPVAETFLP